MIDVIKNFAKHPLLLGAMVGTAMGAAYLLFNHGLEEENTGAPTNTAVNFHFDEQAPSKPVVSAAAKIEEEPEVNEEVQEEETEEVVTPKEEKKPEKKVEKVAANYTLQLLGSGKEANVKKFISKHALEKKARYVRTKRGSEDWYVVIYGEYASLEEAKAAMKAVSPELKQSGITPWVREMRGLNG